MYPRFLFHWIPFFPAQLSLANGVYGLFPLLIVFSNGIFKPLVAHGLSHCQFPSANNVFKLPVAHGLSHCQFPSYSNRFHMQRQKLDSASKRMTKSWYIMQKSISFMCCSGHPSTFSFHHFMIWHFNLFIYLGQKIKVRF